MSWLNAATELSPEREWDIHGVSRVYETVKRLGFPRTLYVSPGDWERIRRSFKVESDAEGAFFWIGPTAIRLKPGSEVIDKSGESLWSG